MKVLVGILLHEDRLLDVGGINDLGQSIAMVLIRVSEGSFVRLDPFLAGGYWLRISLIGAVPLDSSLGFIRLDNVFEVKRLAVGAILSKVQVLREP